MRYLIESAREGRLYIKYLERRNNNKIEEQACVHANVWVALCKVLDTDDLSDILSLGYFFSLERT